MLIGPAFLIWPILTGQADVTMLTMFPIFGVGFPAFFYKIALDTEVNNEGVCIRFWPFHRKWLVFKYEDILKAEACTYSPLKDYGGWGIRSGPRGKAYNVSGDKGVVLTFRNGKSILIGSTNDQSLRSTIQEKLSQN